MLRKEIISLFIMAVGLVSELPELCGNESFKDGMVYTKNVVVRTERLRLSP
jgi:hypothetical protein